MTQETKTANRLDIFCATSPGLEGVLREELLTTGFSAPKITGGGVSFKGRWQEVWRANLSSRIANRVLVRMASFEAKMLPQLEKECAQIDWAMWLPPRSPLRVSATCKKSAIYHSDAAAERVSTAALKSLDGRLDDDGFSILVRIEKDRCTISLDTSGLILYKRGYKIHPVPAPLRETMAAAFLKMCGYDGTQTLFDPMCGSGTIPIEAAMIASGALPGTRRAFAFQDLPSFDPKLFESITTRTVKRPGAAASIYASDRDEQAVGATIANAERAGVSESINASTHSLSQLRPPMGKEPGLVMMNPPYGERLSAGRDLRPLYGAIGEMMRGPFAGWRLGLVTSDDRLAKATGLTFRTVSAPVPHGPLRVQLYQT